MKDEVVPVPRDERDLAEAVAGARGALRVRGGGTRPVGRPVAGADLSTCELSGVTLYEPAALTLVVKAGTPVAEVEAALSAEGQALPFEPMDHRALLNTTGAPTIGGVVAANVSGPRRIQAGACRDSLIGVRFVDGSGTVVKNGGRVMKNVTGYDLVKLMAGSHGTLGVLTEVSFKVLPRAASVASLCLEGLDEETARRAMSAALASPFDVTGAAHAATEPDAAPATWLRLEGFEASVAYRAGRLRELLAPFGEAETVGDPDRVSAAWTAIRDVAAFADRPVVWKVSVKPTDGPALAAELRRTHQFETLYDWGGGLIWIASAEDGAAALHGDLQAAAGRARGHATLVKGSDGLRAEVPVFQPLPAPLAAVSARLRAKFDPRGILNPGVMG